MVGPENVGIFATDAAALRPLKATRHRSLVSHQNHRRQPRILSTANQILWHPGNCRQFEEKYLIQTQFNLDSKVAKIMTITPSFRCRKENSMYGFPVIQWFRLLIVEIVKVACVIARGDFDALLLMLLRLRWTGNGTVLMPIFY